MVDAQGGIVTANSSHNPDLLWASCGGAGSNFGIVTSMHLQVSNNMSVVSVQQSLLITA